MSLSENMSVPTEEPRYADHTRFEIELEFVQCLGNPLYLHELATRNYFDQAEFVAYLDYLQYFKESKYARYLFYPGPTLRVLELIQQKPFRDRLADINFAQYLAAEFAKAIDEKVSSDAASK